jgi:predicted small lipoprotein YifL
VTPLRVARLAIALALALSASVSGCGQTGPLYLPDDGGIVITRPGPAASTEASTPAPAVPGGDDAATVDGDATTRDGKPPAKR